MSRKEQILEKVNTIPSMPTAAARVISLLQNPEVEISELMSAIEYDPGLTSNVLRLANSAYFAGPRQIGSLRDAIVRLGMNRIFQLVITSAIVPLARQRVRGYDIPAGKLLEHSVGVAIAAEELANLMEVTPPAHTFTAGLLHDLGKIVLGTFLEIDAAPIVALAHSENLSFEVAEGRVLGMNHAEVGAVLLERWNLPSSIVNVARYHHQPQPVEEDTLTVDLVHMANNLCLQCGIGTGSVDGLQYRPSQESTARLHLSATASEKVLCKMMSGIQDLQDLLGPNYGR